MTALFDEPLRITIRSDLYPIETEHPVGMLLGFAVEAVAPKSPGRQLLGIVCLSNGSTVLLPQNAYTIDWRYSVETDRFIDTNVPEDDRDT